MRERAVVHTIERHLPVAPYDAEWEAVGRGTDPQIYLPVTRVEARIPWIFTALYVAQAVGCT